ncbi:MAG TPA: fumarylacetoacetate hydrolase family protein [Acidimicrobiales bacterium]|nr:fumarylacetoacetate hydrolase family protein [Acidimicrobiales bacterium]
MLLPYGVDDDGHVVVAWADRVVDLHLAEGLDVDRAVFATGRLNDFMALGPDAWAATRRQLTGGIASQPAAALRPAATVRLVLPWEVGDYADFYASRPHVEAMGRALRPGDDPLPPAWLHLPMGYHGRSGTVVVSGEPVYRPSGFRPGPGGPAYGPTDRLDAEAELGFVIGTGVPRGRTVDAVEAEHHIFGMVLVNDWSARDIQAFESRPLGPFLGKSFATSVSPWVVPMAALDRYRVAGPVQDPPVAGHLQAVERRNIDVRMTLSVDGKVVSRPAAGDLYWSPAQQLAHLTANGAGVRSGDLFATGTISGPGPGPDQAGSLMEAWGGTRWLEDGAVVSITGWCGDHTVGTVSAEVVGR